MHLFATHQSKELTTLVKIFYKKGRGGEGCEVGVDGSKPIPGPALEKGRENCLVIRLI